MVRRDLTQLPQKFLPVGRIALGGGTALLLRVQPIFLSASENVVRLKRRPVWSCHACAICASVQAL
jgi:hypothetical protein